MSISKAINKKSFYGATNTGQTPDIAMPPLDAATPISQMAPDPWGGQPNQSNQPIQQASNSPFQVPDELPAETQQAMHAMQTAEQPQPEYAEQQAPQYQEQQPQQQEAQESFTNLRIQKAKAERERDALLAQMLEMQTMMQSKQQQKAPEPEYQDEDIDIDEDSLVEGKVVKKMYQNMKQLEAKVNSYNAQSQQSIQDAQIKAQYPDFDRVCSLENIEILNETYPDVARALAATSNYYDKASSAYKIIKNFGIYRNPVQEQERARISANAQKPRPLTSVSPQQGDSPLSRANAFANGMTDDLKEQLRKEMFAARKAL
jgi:hypothetical protein